MVHRDNWEIKIEMVGAVWVYTCRKVEEPTVSTSILYHALAHIIAKDRIFAGGPNSSAIRVRSTRGFALPSFVRGGTSI